MAELRFQLPRSDDEYVGRVAQGMHFCDPRVRSFALEGELLTVALADDAAADDVREKVERLLERYRLGESAPPGQVYWQVGESRDDGADAMPGLVERGWVTREGSGRMALRGPAADLLEFLDETLVRRLGAGFQRESYPAVIDCAHLLATRHIASFPQHVLYVTHLREDLDVIDEFERCAKQAADWGKELAGRSLDLAAPPDVLLNPAVCYHCYLNLRGEDVRDAPRSVTARSRCFRHEGGELTSLRRLADFSMREFILVGPPDWVKQARGELEQGLRALVEEWGLAASLVTANDPFFTDDYRLKAAIQRQQDHKRELVVQLPTLGMKRTAEMAIASSNFHSTTLAEAFGVRSGRRPACTGCVAFGLERWVYALFVQNGLDVDAWTGPLGAAFSAWRRGNAAD